MARDVGGGVGEWVQWVVGGGWWVVVVVGAGFPILLLKDLS